MSTAFLRPGLEQVMRPGLDSLFGQVYGFVEFYAGVGACSLCSRLAGIPTASLDITYHKAKSGKQNYMDILSDAGMGSFSCSQLQLVEPEWQAPEQME